MPSADRSFIVRFRCCFNQTCPLYNSPPLWTCIAAHQDFQYGRAVAAAGSAESEEGARAKRNGDDDSVGSRFGTRLCSPYADNKRFYGIGAELIEFDCSRDDSIAVSASSLCLRQSSRQLAQVSRHRRRVERELETRRPRALRRPKSAMVWRSAMIPQVPEFKHSSANVTPPRPKALLSEVHFQLIYLWLNSTTYTFSFVCLFPLYNVL